VNLAQLKTILWLRWRLTRNQWARSRGVGAVIAALVILALSVLAITGFLGALVGGMFGLKAAAAQVVMGVWLGLTLLFLFLWVIGLLNELQRSESIDLQRLMHLPVRLGQIFVINYLASHLSLSVIIAVPTMIGLAIGLAISRGPEMLLLAPLALSMVLMVSAWTYFLRGWLATLMSNPRRRRTVIMGITLTFVLLSQAPNLYFNVLRGRAKRPSRSFEEAQQQRTTQNASRREKLDQLIRIQKFIPPLWVPFAAGTLAEGRPLPALLGTAGCLAIGALGLRRAYRDTVRFYHGETGRKARAPIRLGHGRSADLPPTKTGSAFVELRLAGVPEQAAALALATLRSMLRAPEVKMAWGSSFLVTLIVGASFVLRGAPQVPEAAKPFIATGVVVFSVFMFIQFLSNQFGFDRDGFRSLIFSPADRRLILIGKNLANLPVCALFGLILLTLFGIWVRPAILTLAAALFQLATVVLIAGLVGNLLSILTPYRIQPGSMKPTKMPGLAMLVMILCHLLFPLAMTPVFGAALAELLWQHAGWPPSVPVNLLLSLALAALVGVLYWWTLDSVGRLLQRRETKILSVVTVEVE
jgi:ABC-2 type transport system permease protein